MMSREHPEAKIVCGLISGEFDYVPLSRSGMRRMMKRLTLYPMLLEFLNSNLTMQLDMYPLQSYGEPREIGPNGDTDKPTSHTAYIRSFSFQWLPI
jgi:hypothetical protein